MLFGLEDEKELFSGISFNEFEKPEFDPDFALKYHYNPDRSPCEKDNKFYSLQWRQTLYCISFERQISAYREVQNKFYVRNIDRNMEEKGSPFQEVNEIQKRLY